MRTLSIDIETFSDIDIKLGVYRYVDTPNFKILLLAYSYDDEPIKLIDLTCEKIPTLVIEDLYNPDVLKTAYNASFEIACICKFLGKKLDPRQWECTMVKSMMLSLPVGLGKTSEVLGLAEEKDTKGKALIRYFSVPCKGTKANDGRTVNLPEHDRLKWQEFKDYCIQDVRVEKAIRDKLSWYTIPKTEHTLWVQDINLNAKGILVDMELIEGALKNAEVVKANLMQTLMDLTGLQNPNSTSQMKSWIENELGYTIDGLNKECVQGLLDTVENQKVLEVLELRKLTSKTSISKYKAASKCVCSDGCIRGTLQYYGASRTGRWAGRLVQVHNLPQNHMDDLGFARDVVKRGNYELTQLFYGYVQSTLSELIRTMFVAKKGKTFVVVDFSAIEARVIAWLAGETWRMDVFNGHGKIYEASASQMFNVPIEEITKGSDLRKKGKVAELALGYQGGPGALIRMGALSGGLREEELQPLVNTWRASNRHITKLWYDCNSAMMNAIDGEPCTVKGIKFYREKGFLFIDLPSGRRLSYPKPIIVDGKFGKAPAYKNFSKKIKGVDDYVTEDTYGGKIVENIVQAMARDCLAVNLLKLEDLGYDIKFHVHDEIIIEVNKDRAEEELKNIENIMAINPDWAKDLPLNADGYVTEYYKKD